MAANEAQEFDYVIVGAGAAGCAIANQLSADPSLRICVLEAGPPDSHMMIKIPAGFTKIIANPRYVWQFDMAPSDGVNGRSIPFVQGKTLGGGTSVNGMVYIRGQPADFDGWAAEGNPGWSHADLLPYFKAIERRSFGEAGHSGDSGPIEISQVRRRDALLQAFMDAGSEIGLPPNPDYNGSRQLGVAYTQTTTSGRRRVSSADAFLRPAIARGNVQVVTDAVAERIEFEDCRATGVSYRRGGKTIRVDARAEVILAAGAINTPRLLQVSGVGDPALLTQLGVPLVIALPGVGANLQDHYLCSITAEGQNFRSINQLARGLPLVAQVARYFAGAESILELVPPLISWFAQSGFGSDDADIQGMFTPASNDPGKGRILSDYAGMTIAFWQHRPISRGFVHAVSREINIAPIVQPNYLDDELDRQVTLAGLKVARRFLHSAAMSPFVKRETAPGDAVKDDAALLEYLGQIGRTAYHFSGTAKMGAASDRTSVVDNELRVHGLFGLRIADASIMPSVVSGNTQTSSMMIGLKAGDMIRSTHRQLNQPAAGVAG